MDRQSSGRAFAKRVYRPRIVGTLLCAPIIATALYSNPPSHWAWALLMLNVLVWPHIANRLSLRSLNPFRAEIRNFQIDSLFCGLWIAAMGMNPIASLTMASMVTMNNIAAGGWKLLRTGALLQLAGLALHMAVFSTPFQESNMLDVWACLPLLLAYPLTVGWASHSLASELTKTKKILRMLCITDSLTGLINRRHWDEVINQKINSQPERQKIFLVAIDIDHFKTINDTYGHVTGDDILRTLGGILNSKLRQTDFVGRYGGDEFCAMLTNTSAEEALILMDRVRVSFNRIGQEKFNRQFSLSIGIAGWRDEFADAQTWFAEADKLLYRAKQNGRNCIEIDQVPQAA